MLRTSRSSFIVLFLSFLFVLLVLNNFYTLITLLFENFNADAIRPIELPGPSSALIEARTKLIPKIIHQTWINESIPQKWVTPQNSCRELHKDYEYMFWTDVKSREFIAREYPWFLPSFDAYPYPIERADVIRYFVLLHYGGIYIDLDVGCERSLDPLLSFPAWLRSTIPTGVSNDVMGSKPNHPFFHRTVDSLKTYARNWYLPYLTVMYSTGPLFLSVIWKGYIRWGVPEADRVRILMPDDQIGNPWSFFKKYQGSSWHQEDASLVFWASEHWVFLSALGLTVVLGALLGAHFAWKRYKAKAQRGRHRDLETASTAPLLKDQ